jgi:hypothetical protein
LNFLEAQQDRGLEDLVDVGGEMLTLLEAVLAIVLIVTIMYYWRTSRQKPQGTLEERIVALERQNKELRNAIAILLFKVNAFESQLPLSPEQKQQIKSLEEQITVARYLDSIFPS